MSCGCERDNSVVDLAILVIERSLARVIRESPEAGKQIEVLKIPACFKTENVVLAENLFLHAVLIRFCSLHGMHVEFHAIEISDTIGHGLRYCFFELAINSVRFVA